MKRIFIAIIFLFVGLFAEDSLDKVKKIESENQKLICRDAISQELQRRGCCSWHGGVSGCSSGRIVCNDGTYSPSCTCNIPVNPLG